MKLNSFLWNLYKQSEQGKKTIQLFSTGPIDDIFNAFLDGYSIDYAGDGSLTQFLVESSSDLGLPSELSFEQAGVFFNDLIKKGFSIDYEDGKTEEYDLTTAMFFDLIHVVSTWLYKQYPDIFKPYFFKTKFRQLTRITDSFEIELPSVPLKRYLDQRISYYWQICQLFHQFQIEHQLTPEEFCAFLYDFAPKYLSEFDDSTIEMPKPTQVWMIGGSGSDFYFLDEMKMGGISFWQGNIDTKRGDILVMYCLAPRSYIHSVWRAVSDGIANPFFHHYGSVNIGHGQKVPPVTLNEFKTDDYFKSYPLVRKNFQGVNGFPLSTTGYHRLIVLINAKTDTLIQLPELYNFEFTDNENLLVEKDVELVLIEPLLLQLGYKAESWVRQLSVRMGRGERNFPDYAFLTKTEKGFEAASMLVEAKYHIANNKELEDAFKQVWSYGQRLSAKKLVIADKNAIWIYQQHNGGFDRTKYIKKFWKELLDAEHFKQVRLVIGK